MAENAIIQLAGTGSTVAILLYLLSWFMKREERIVQIIERNTEAFIELKTIITEKERNKQ